MKITLANDTGKLELEVMEGGSMMARAGSGLLRFSTEIPRAEVLRLYSFLATAIGKREKE